MDDPGLHLDDQGDYGDGYQDAYIPNGEFDLINSVIGDGIQKEKDIGLSTLAFDTHEELLWMGTKSGHVTSYYGTHLQKYTSFQVHPVDEVRNILTLDSGILILTNTCLRSQMRRGIPIFTHTSENLIDMHSILGNRNGRILMGGMQDKLVEYDLSTGRETRVEQLDGGTCAILRDHSRFVCCGDAAAGKIVLRDPISLKVAHSLEAHSGGALSDFDVHGHHLVTCGQSIRHGIAQPDRFLMIYDLRILRAISPIQVMVMPYQLRFLPALSSRIAVLSSMGQVELVDTAALTTPQISIFQINMMVEGSSTISMDISPSNQCMAFGDNSNAMHLYSSVADPVLNPYARDTEFADQAEQLPPMDINDPFAIYSSVPRPNLPPEQESYASDYWPQQLCRQAYRPTPEVDSEILRTMKVVGTVGYARKTSNMKRNQVRYPNVMRGYKDHEGGGGLDGGKARTTSAGTTIPRLYQRVAVKLTKMGTDDFDFDRFNRTGFSGLEASLPNSYCNAMLQVLYYSERLRLLMMNHTCSRENCICCELSFLFHMMEISPNNGSTPCHTGNFLRAMRTIPEASGLGLVFTDQQAVWKTNVSRLIQSWNRFILHQISLQVTPALVPEKTADGTSSPFKAGSRAEGEPAAIFTKLFGIAQNKINTCTKCLATASTKDTVLLCDLIYPDSRERCSFARVVSNSMCSEQLTPAWCDQCKKYQPTTQSRRVTSLPYVVSLNAGLDSPGDMAFWQAQMERLHSEHCAKDNVCSEATEAATTTAAVTAPAAEAPQQPPQPPANVKQCRYGTTCSRPDCKFWHPGTQSCEYNSSKDDVDIGDKLTAANVSWVPHQICIRRHASGKVSSDEDPEPEDDPIMEKMTYRLCAICYIIKESATGEIVNIVSAINVGPFYHSRIAKMSAVSQWYIFNDFSVSTINANEAVWVNLTWKVPCVMMYEAVDELPPLLRQLSFHNPIGQDVFGEDKSLGQRSRKRITFMPLLPDEMPKKGDLVAIDAEFVTLNQEESELRSDGKLSTVKAAHMSVARVTCVRGGGANEGQPFIDDYISTQEQVVDYVTRFSGIKPGDLDAQFSSKHLTTLKSTYKKLRYLIDLGCIFIGHGLRNDFKVINLVVPIDQVMDTVQLFHIPHNRYISLKFLAWHLLGKKIQTANHDSIEDAVTALELYKHYLRLKREDKLIESLNSLYDAGKACNWRVPDDQD